MVFNPNQRFYFTISTDYNNTLGTDIVIVVAKNNKLYLFQDCLSGTNVASKHIGGLYTLVCVNVRIAHYYDPQVDGTACELDGMKTIEFGPFQNTPSSQRYSIEKSTTQSGTTIDSRTLSRGSSISLGQSTTTESVSRISTRPTFRYTATQQANELKTDFTIVTLPTVIPTTTRPHSSVEQSPIVTAPIFATKGSQTGASVDPSTTSLTPIWTIDIPGYLGPWTFLTVDITKDGTQGTFEYTSAEILLNGVLVSSAVIQVTSDIRITSTAAGSSITHEQSTTVFTMTSFFDNICAPTPVTTGYGCHYYGK